MVWWCGGLLVALLLFSACGAAPTGAGTSGTASGGQSSSVVTTEPATTPSAGVIATWTRSGGIAGITEVMTVYADGRVTIERDGKQQTANGDMATVQALEETFASAEWQALKPVYGEQFPDAFEYTVRGGGKEVKTYDGAANPEPLATLLQRLDQLYQAASKSK